MTLFSLIFAGIRRAPRRYLGLIFLLVIGGAAVTVSTVLGAMAQAEATAGLDDASTLRTIVAYNDAGLLTEKTLQDIRALPGIESAQPVIAVPVGLGPQLSALTLLPWNPQGGVPLTAGSAPATGLKPGTVVLPATADGHDLTALVDHEAVLIYTEARTENSGVTAELKVHVVALSDPGYQVDALNAAYAPIDTVIGLAAARAGVPKEQYLAGQGYERISMVARSMADVDPLLEELQSQGIHAISQSQQLGAVPGVINLIRIVSSVLLGALLVVGAVAVAALAQGIGQARRRDIGVLKAFGWSGTRLRAVLVAETAVVCCGAQLVGTALGLLASPFVEGRLRELTAGADLAPGTIPIGILALGNLAVLAFFSVVVWLVMGRAVRQPVIDVLRSV
jgi:putative ABC transport system permease protein